VNPGFGGQKFIEATLPKIRRCRQMIDDLTPHVLLEVDGGVSLDTVSRISEAGADVLVSGSAVFRGDDYAANIRALKARMGG
jgi:ribulose-phosphate 3-epimerase